MSEATIQQLMQTELSKLLAIMLVLALPGFISLLRDVLRSRANVGKREAEAKAIRERYVAEEAQQRSQATNTLALAIAENVKHLGAMVEEIRLTREEGERRDQRAAKQSVELQQQTETLETLQALGIRIEKDVTDGRREVKPAIEAVAALPGSITEVKVGIDEARKVINTLPEDLKAQLLPITVKLDTLDRHVEQMSQDLKAQIADLRSEVLAAIRAALAQPAKAEAEPSFVAAAVAEATGQPIAPLTEPDVVKPEATA